MLRPKPRGAKELDAAGGRGATFQDADGHDWVDLGSLTFNVNVGHGHPHMIAALKAQAERLSVATPHAVFEGKSELAEQRSWTVGTFESFIY